MASLLPTLDPPAGWLEPSEKSMKEAIRREFPTTGNKFNKSRNWQYKYPEGDTLEAIKALSLKNTMIFLDIRLTTLTLTGEGKAAIL